MSRSMMSFLRQVLAKKVQPLMNRVRSLISLNVVLHRIQVLRYYFGKPLLVVVVNYVLR
jgi:hypothetical protein